jgi:hypothetical protein
MFIIKKNVIASTCRTSSKLQSDDSSFFTFIFNFVYILTLDSILMIQIAMTC